MIEPIGSDELVMAGITTVVGVLGCDGVGRNMQPAYESEGAGNQRASPRSYTRAIMAYRLSP